MARLLLNYKHWMREKIDEQSHHLWPTSPTEYLSICHHQWGPEQAEEKESEILVTGFSAKLSWAYFATPRLTFNSLYRVLGHLKEPSEGFEFEGEIDICYTKLEELARKQALTKFCPMRRLLPGVIESVMTKVVGTIKVYAGTAYSIKVEQAKIQPPPKGPISDMSSLNDRAFDFDFFLCFRPGMHHICPSSHYFNLDWSKLFIWAGPLLATNVAATLLTGYKAWCHYLILKEIFFLDCNTLTRAQKVLRLLAESGAISCILWVIRKIEKPGQHIAALCQSYR
ncbi:hypothetical protein K435DRAFT_800754 [Dendrothele bispora CBS 962.96]|uniref:Uncharacterized protein n=1 Tax=Dendrothele bispora (strain CBS 962.96) TaxID=1314807 RepID=A0A4S8LS02_DENBC|nr:hypothetical protein K435DRAFT_800754 [Dendrothele bispora CBS 962.96]